MSVSIFHVRLIFAAVKIPVIVVLTKYDYLVVEHFRACDQKLPLRERKAEAIFRAERAFKGITKGLKVPFAPVSTQKEERDDYGGLLIRSITILFHFNIATIAGAMLINLTKVTRENLRDVEGSLWALWATAQQINARQKVDLSIRCVFSTINMHSNYDTSPIC